MREHLYSGYDLPLYRPVISGTLPAGRDRLWAPIAHTRGGSRMLRPEPLRGL